MGKMNKEIGRIYVMLWMNGQRDFGRVSDWWSFYAIIENCRRLGIKICNGYDRLEGWKIS
jgi:hypothetical protein